MSARSVPRRSGASRQPPRRPSSQGPNGSNQRAESDETRAAAYQFIELWHTHAEADCERVGIEEVIATLKI